MPHQRLNPPDLLLTCIYSGTQLVPIDAPICSTGTFGACPEARGLDGHRAPPHATLDEKNLFLRLIIELKSGWPSRLSRKSRRSTNTLKPSSFRFYQDQPTPLTSLRFRLSRPAYEMIQIPLWRCELDTASSQCAQDSVLDKLFNVHTETPTEKLCIPRGTTPSTPPRPLMRPVLREFDEI